MTREDIIAAVHCPSCNARRGRPCSWTGKRAAKKTREGSVHEARMKAAQRQQQRRKAPVLTRDGLLYYDLTPEQAKARGPA